jgi:hypothetical protein
MLTDGGEVVVIYADGDEAAVVSKDEGGAASSQCTGSDGVGDGDGGGKSGTSSSNIKRSSKIVPLKLAPPRP